MKTICFVNMKGGVGKTTLAINVADCLRRVHNKKVALIDIDPQFNATQCLFSTETYISHLKSGNDTILQLYDQDVISSASVLHGASETVKKKISEVDLVNIQGLSVLPGNIDLYRVEMTTGEGREFILKRFLNEKLEKEEYDYVIIDTPPTPSIWMTSALIASDYYLIPTKPEPLSIIGIDLLRNIIDRRSTTYGLNIRCLGVVLTMIERIDSVVFSATKQNLLSSKVWKNYLFKNYLAKKASYARNQINQPFILEGDEYELRRHLQEIVKEIIQKVEK